MPAALPYPCLCLVTDRGVCPADEIPGRVSAAIAGGVDMVQLRDKELPGSVILDLAVALRRVCDDHALLLVNERADVAVASRAEGVQLGELAMPTESIRPVVGYQALIGRSVHSVGSAIHGAEGGADFLLVGTMFATRSHPGEEPSGPGLLNRIRAGGVQLPLLGIGGITSGNVCDVMLAGAHGVAVITSVLASADPQAAAQSLKSAMLDAISSEGDPGPRSFTANQPSNNRPSSNRR